MLTIDPPDGDWTGASIAEHLGLGPFDVVLVEDVLEIRADVAEADVVKAMEGYPGPPPPPPTEEERLREFVLRVIQESKR